ncbi:MAG: hypothetical protein KDE63_02065 [Novosphingobium sp.]|nr:hypothetical protein [Novosphingobium sp.]
MTKQDGPVPRQDSSALKISVTGILPGHAYGVTAPTLLAVFKFPTDDLLDQDIDWPAIDKVLHTFWRDQATYVQLLAELEAEDTAKEGGRDSSIAYGFAHRVATLVANVIAEAGLPLFARPQIRGWNRRDTGGFDISVAAPYLPGHANHTRNAIIMACRTIMPMLSGAGQVSDQGRMRAQLIAQISKAKLHGTNTLRFLEAAQRADIPLHYLSQAVCQYGWGANQLRGQSSILDTTSNLGVAIARDKFACATILRQSALPGAAHILAANLAIARKAATRIGYPVVVKPADKDGGVGVVSQITNEQQLDKAWNAAARVSKKVLVEKYCEGEDIRLIVVDGTLRWAVGRQQAGVTGNGRSTIIQLVEEANLDSRRGYHAAASLRPLKIDEEALDVLHAQGITPDTVPTQGQFVALRTAANLSSGGTPRNVTDLVHPETRAMVERAVAVLDLDIAGVDLITRDITRPWHETGATIIEINAQPQLIAASQDHLYAEILRARLGSGNGRIPVALVLAQKGEPLVEDLRKRLEQPDCKRIGLGMAPQAEIGGKPFGVRCASAYRAGYALLMHRDVEGMILVAQDAELLKTGLPFDRCGLVAATPGFLNGQQDGTAKEIFDMCQPHFTGAPVSVSSPADDQLPEWFSRYKTNEVPDSNALIEHVVRFVRNDRSDAAAQAAASAGKTHQKTGATG